MQTNQFHRQIPGGRIPSATIALHPIPETNRPSGTATVAENGTGPSIFGGRPANRGFVARE